MGKTESPLVKLMVAEARRYSRDAGKVMADVLVAWSMLRGRRKWTAAMVTRVEEEMRHAG